MGQLQGIDADMAARAEGLVNNSDVISVQRTPAIEEQRRLLPIMNEEGTILEAVKERDVLVLCGETGSGKTTQVPQFLYEAGYTRRGLIGVTEPRRVAAVSVAGRVAQELGKGAPVAHQIRYDTTVSAATRIKFMTDGILLKELQADFALRQYTVLILDEAHERSLNTDILLGLLSRVVPLRRKMHEESLALPKDKQVAPLKLIIMSATLRVGDFTENRRLFSTPPPVIKVDARQYPVTIHFNRKTAEDYMGEAFNKVCKIHRTLPPGAILVFLTGQGEIDQLCRKLRGEFPSSAKGAAAAAAKRDVTKPQRPVKTSHKDALLADEEEAAERAAERQAEDDSGEADGVESKPEEEAKAPAEGEEAASGSDAEMERQFPPLLVLPLYSMLSTDQQMRVFQPPPPGVRLCVVATNVAETSLTIPGVKYVVDCGRAKERTFDRATGIARFEVSWIAQASANQRAGRAGRTEAGHCYRLYSSAVFSTFPQFGEPEIMRMPVEGIVLQMKSMGIDNVATFPFATPPPSESIASAIKTLCMLGALESDEPHKATELGTALAALPVPPRSGKLLVNARGLGCLNYALAVAALLSVSTDPIMRREAAKEAEEGATEEEKERVRKEAAAAAASERQWHHPASDILGLLKAYGAFEFAGCAESFCLKNALHYKTMKEVHDLRGQLHALLKTVLPDVTDSILDLSKPPTEAQAIQIRQLILGSYLDQIAKLTPIPSGPNQPHVPNHYVTVSGADAFIHPTSALARDLPAFVVYRELLHTTRPYMRGVTAITASWVSALAPSLCKFSTPLENPAPKYNVATDRMRCFVNVTFGPSWQLPVQEIDFPEGHERVKHFARLLLEGEVFPRLAECKTWWASKPSIITRTWEMPKILDLVSALESRNAISRAKLGEIWAKEPRFLLREVSAWVLPEHKPTLTAMWPPLDLSAKKKAAAK